MEIGVLKAQLDAMRRQQGVYLPLDQFNSMEASIKEQARPETTRTFFVLISD